MIDSEASDQVIYQIVAQHWAHSEQIRWTLLYNFLVASTILLLAWSTIFASTTYPKGRTAVLILFCLAGFSLSVVWTALGSRGSSFVDMYSGLGRRLEVEITGQQLNRGAFQTAEKHRQTIKGIARWVRTRLVMVVVPILFAGLYTVLGIVSVLK